MSVQVEKTGIVGKKLTFYSEGLENCQNAVGHGDMFTGKG